MFPLDKVLENERSFRVFGVAAEMEILPDVKATYEDGEMWVKIGDKAGQVIDLQSGLEWLVIHIEKTADVVETIIMANGVYELPGTINKVVVQDKVSLEAFKDCSISELVLVGGDKPSVVTIYNGIYTNNIWFQYKNSRRQIVGITGNDNESFYANKIRNFIINAGQCIELKGSQMWYQPEADYVGEGVYVDFGLSEGKGADTLKSMFGLTGNDGILFGGPGNKFAAYKGESRNDLVKIINGEYNAKTHSEVWGQDIKVTVAELIDTVVVGGRYFAKAATPDMQSTLIWKSDWERKDVAVKAGSKVVMLGLDIGGTWYKVNDVPRLSVGFVKSGCLEIGEIHEDVGIELATYEELSAYYISVAKANKYTDTTVMMRYNMQDPSRYGNYGDEAESEGIQDYYSNEFMGETLGRYLVFTQLKDKEGSPYFRGKVAVGVALPVVKFCKVKKLTGDRIASFVWDFPTDMDMYTMKHWRSLITDITDCPFDNNGYKQFKAVLFTDGHVEIDYRVV